MQDVSVCWLRRDLRIYDHRALSRCLASQFPSLCVFIFDPEILKFLPKEDRRVDFIFQALQEMQTHLRRLGSSLLVMHGGVVECHKKILKDYNVKELYFNGDYENYALERDKKVFELYRSRNVDVQMFVDHHLFSKSEILKKDLKPYTVYTPYKNKCLELMTPMHYAEAKCEWSKQAVLQCSDLFTLSLEDMGFAKTDLEFSAPSIEPEILKNYAERRDYPGIVATSRLGVHLRFGTVSTRHCVREALKYKSSVWLSEILWREFFIQILAHFPHVAKSSFKPAYDKIEWRENKKEFQLWCEGKTGYPIVDAGMRELNATGFMHNRVRMITASFLCKHLLLPWQWGEKYFAEKLLDFDLSANNGNWQWVAGSGCDAAPYFRVFNPSIQQEKFDKSLSYIKKWVPEHQSPKYQSSQIVTHAEARIRCLNTYNRALKP